MVGLQMLHVALIASLAVTTMAVAAERVMYKGNELPPYEVSARDGALEIRDYGPHLLAEVTVEGERRGAINRGFRVLANYIFGGNETGEKIAMTVPVTQTAAAADTKRWVVRFMMPSSYTQDTLPTAESPFIRFVEEGAVRQAVLGFSGRATTQVLEAKSAELLTRVEAQGLTPVGEPRYYFYDDPMTLPWNRRNEVAIVLR